MLTQLAQVIHIEDLPAKLETGGNGKDLGLCRQAPGLHHPKLATLGICLMCEGCTPVACSPDEGLEEDKQGFDEHGRVHNIQGLDVFLVPAG